MILFSWVLFSIFVGVIGITRKIGFLGALLLSLALSPIVGFAFTMVSKDKQTDLMEKQMQQQQRNQGHYGNYQQKGNYKLIILAAFIFLILIALAVFFMQMYF